MKPSVAWSILVYLWLSQPIFGFIQISLTIKDYLGPSWAWPFPVYIRLFISCAIMGYLVLSSAIMTYLCLSWAFSGYLGISRAISGKILQIVDQSIKQHEQVIQELMLLKTFTVQHYRASRANYVTQPQNKFFFKILSFIIF